MKSETWLSLLGAVTGLTAMALQLWQFALSGSRIKLIASLGMNENTEDVAMVIDVKNRGRLACTIESVSVELEWGGRTIPLSSMSSGFFSGPTLPARVDLGSNLVWAISAVHILNRLPKGSQSQVVRALIILSNGKKLRSNKFAVSRNGDHGPIYSAFRLRITKVWCWGVRKFRGHNGDTRERKRMKNGEK